MQSPLIDGLSERDIPEYEFPESVLSILLKDRTTGENIRWCTDAYASRGEGFQPGDQILASQLVDPDDPVIRPRVDKCAEEQRRRAVDKAEVFTPSWVCNKQNNLVDASWFGWTQKDSSPFNMEMDGQDLGGTRWKSTTGTPIRFPDGKSWRDYVKSLRLEVSCGEAPYLVSRYDTVSGMMIPVSERIGFLDRKLRVITENLAGRGQVPDFREWFFYARLAVQSVYGFDWQGDNVFLARENVLATVIETFSSDFLGKGNFGSMFTEQAMVELAEIVSWNIWQMDGIKFVVPDTCRPMPEPGQLHMSGLEPRMLPCPGCRANDPLRHNGVRCRVMSWETGTQVHFMPPFDFEPINEEVRR